MSIIIQEVNSAQDLKTFIYLPEKIHKNHKNWIPPLYMDEEKFFDKNKNPAFTHNTTLLCLAYEGDIPVGRIMGIIPEDFNMMHSQKTARFSYFECYENKEIFNALLSYVENWALSKGCNQVIGPMGFSDKEPQGFLTSGFAEKMMMVTNHNYQYMTHFIQANGYHPYVELCQYEVPINKETLAKYDPFANRVLQHQNIKVLEFTSTKQIKTYVKPVFDLINKTYTEIYGFTKVTTEEADEFAKRFLPLLNPKLVKILTDENNQVIAFVIAMPNLNEGIKKAKGKLFPFGWIPILHAFKKSRRLVLLLGAVDPHMQNKGLDAVLAIKLLGSALHLGFKEMDSHLIMRQNLKMRGIIERIDGSEMYKQYAIFSKLIMKNSII